MRRLVAALFAAAMLFAASAHAQTEVPSNWTLKPSGLSVGDEFRLVFMGKNSRNADSTDIAVYDAYAQGRIADIGHADIKAYASHFKVLGSTATVNARTHTGTTGAGGVPIYWLNGSKVADDYGDFYDGSWNDKDGATLEDGTSLSSGRKDQFICTGTNDDGTTASQPMGAATCAGTKINISGNTLSGTSASSSTASRYLVLSGVFRVGNFTATTPAIESVRVTSDPGSDGEYVKDDAIKVTVTFSEAVAVTGTPRIKMRLFGGATPVRPRYVAAESTATALVFSYTVKAEDYSHDGVIFPRDGIVLGNNGSIKNQAGAVDADLDYAAIEARSGHKVHVKPKVDSVTMASTPVANGIYRTGETIQVDLTFDKEVRVFTDFGTPELRLSLGGRPREAAYTTTVGDDVVRFEYVVQAGDSDLDGISFMSNAIVWNDGAIIRKEHGDVDDLDELKILRVAQNGGTASTLPQTGHRVNVAVSTDATLYNLILDDGNGAEIPMNPAFALTTTSYTASVAYAVDEITIVPTVNEIHATVAYLDASDTALTDADANKNGFQAPLSVGANTIKVKVTAEDDSTTLTYTITVTRGAASTDATLDDLILNDGNGADTPMNPTFASTTTSYTASVISSVDEITVLPTVNESNAKVAYLNASDTALTDADANKNGFQAPLSVGANTIKVKVTAQDEATTETYTVVVTRAALVPGQVTGVKVTPGTGWLKVDWNAVSGVDGYKVQWKSGTETFTNAATDSREATVSSGSTTSHTITGLANGTAYDVQIIATWTNAADGTPSAPASGTPVASPGQVTGVDVTPGAGRLKVDWNVVTNADGYRVQWKSGAETFADAAANSREATVTSGSTTSHTITGLANGTAYDVQVIATRTNADDGTPSAPATDTPSQTARITGVAFTNVPSNNVYNLGDTIEVSITFNTAVEVTGTPKVQMYFVDKHQFYEYANYDAASSTDTVLVFKRLVTGDDDNDSTVRVIPDGLNLNGGTIRNKGTTVNAEIAHAGTQTDPDINTRWLEGIAVTSAPAVPETVTGNPVYGPGEKIQFKVTFKNAVDVDQTDGALKLKFRSGSGSATYTADYESGTGTKYLVFAWTVPANMPDDGAGLVVPTNVQGHGHGFDTSQGLALNGGTIESTGGIAVNIRHGQYDTDSRVDTTAPVLSAGAEGATVDGAALALAFQNPDNGNTPDHLDENSSPAAADFAVTVAGSALPVSGVNVSGVTVTLTLASPVNHAETVAVGYTPGTNKIRDRWGNEAAQISSRTVRNDTEPSLSIQAATVGEGDGTAGFTVELGAVSGAQVTVDYATADGTATAGADYTAANGTLTFAPGETSKSISVTITDDDVDEENETFTVTLGNAVNASIGQATATGTITDDDTPASTDATLDDLILNDGNGADTPMNPAFASTTTSYTASVINSVDEITVLPTVNESNATVAYLDASDTALTDADANENGFQAPLSVGANTFKIKVTADDGNTTETYTVVVTRAALAPGQVTGVEVTPGTGRLIVAWDATTNADGYRVQWKSGAETFAAAAADSREAIIASGSTTSHTITGLANGTAYDVQVIATRTNAADGLPSAPASGTPVAAPGQVTGVEVTPGTGQLTVEWAATADADGYKVQWKSGAETFADAATDSREAVIASGSTTSHTIAGLANGTAYDVQVIATRTNAADGLPSAPSSGTPVAAPGRVTGVEVTPGTGQLTVEWAATADGYKVQWKSGAETFADAATDSREAVIASGSTTSHTITGLANGTAYDVQVIATRTNADDGTPSAPASGTPVAAPGRVTGVEVRPGTGQLAVEWAATAAADGYKVQWKSGAETFADAAADSREAVIASGSTTSHTIAGLANGTAYDVQVIATRTNAADGLPSAPASGTPVAAPGRVTGVEVTPGTGQLTVEWAATADGYKVQWKSGAETFADAATDSREAVIASGSTTSHTITGLANGTAYDVQVIATRTNADDGTPSAPASGTPVAAPGRVTGVEVRPGTGQLAVEWAATAAADGYKVQWKSGAETFADAAADSREAVIASGSTTSHTIAGLANGTAYDVQIIATRTNADDGTPSAPASGTPVAAPGQVTGVEVTPGTGRLIVAWAATTNADGYRVQWKSGAETFAAAATDSREAVIASGSTTSHTITGLANGTAYDVQIIATRTNADDGTPSAPASETPAPLTLSIEGGSAAEGDGVIFTVRLSDVSRTDVTMQYRTSIETMDTAALDPSAPGGADFAPVAVGSARIFAGRTTAEILIPTLDDNTDEEDETFTVTLTGVTGAALRTATAKGTIEDNDATAPTVLWTSNGGINVAEVSGAEAEAAFYLTSKSGKTVTVDWRTADGSATAGTDYTAASGTVTFLPGEEKKTVSVVILDDQDTEGQESFSIEFADSVNADVLSDLDTVTVNIGASDSATNTPPAFPGEAVERGFTETLGDGTIETFSTVGARVVASDSDGHTLNYSLSGTDAGKFDIIPRTGQIVTKTGQSYDHEAVATYSVTLTAVDGNSGSDTIEVTIRINDRNEPPLAPAAPTVAAATASTGLTVSWTAPDNTGRPSIDSYDIQYREGTSGPWTDGPQDQTGTNVQITGLTAGTSYEVQVRATNDEGDGAWSASGTGMPVDVTGQVTGVKLTPGTGRLTVEWTAVNGATGYKVQWKSGAETFADAAADSREAVIASGSTTSHTITGLTNGTAYDVQVIATRTNADDGTPSAPASGTPVAAPGQVTGVEVTPGTGQLAVEWATTADADGYKVQWKSGAETFADAAADSREAVIASGSTTSHTITGLANGTAYDVQIIATRTNADDGTPSAPASGTPVAAPGQVTGVEVTPGAGQLAVAWAATAAADGYKVQWKSGAETFADAATDSREAVIASGSTTSHTITGLANGTAYDVQIIATRTNADDGTPSAPASGTPVAAPGQVTGVEVTPGAGQLAVAWAATAAADGYKVQWKSGAETFADAATDSREAVIASGSTTSHTITGLANGTAYDVQIIATRTNADDGTPSAPASGTPVAAPGQVTGVKLTPGTGQLAVAWATTADADGYKVQWKSGAETFADAATDSREAVIASGSTTSHTITGLANGTAYDVQVIATRTNADDGTPSAPASGTPVAAPGQVTGVEVTPGTGQLAVAWDVATNADGYKVQWKSGAETFADAATDSREATVSSGSTTSHTITGLANGTAYDVQVIATRTNADDGTPSAPASGTPVAAPGQVTGVEVTPGTGRLIVAWAATTNADGYRVQWKSGAETFADAATDSREAVIASGSTTSHTIAGLANGTAYDVQVIATRTNADDGTPSAPASGTPVAAPGQVTGVKVTPGTGRLKVDWNAVSGVDGYKVQWKSGTETFTNAATDSREATVSSGSTTSHTITGLANGTAYDVQIIATRTNADDGTPSAPASGTPVAAPGQVTGVEVTPGTGQLAVEWAATADADGYKVQWKSGAETFADAATDSREAVIASGSTTSHTITGLANGTAYDVQVIATRTNADDGTPSAPASGTPVVKARITSVAFTNVPSNNVYGLGDTIEVSITFNTAVEVTGTPKVQMYFVDANRFDEYANYDAASSTDTVLVFKRLVSGDDDNESTVRVILNGLKLNGGTIRNKGTTINADIAHSNTTMDPDISTRWVEGIAVSSDPAVPETVTGNPVYGPGEKIQFKVTFKNAVDVDQTDGALKLKFRSGSGSATYAADYESGTGTKYLVFAWTVPANVPDDGAGLVVPTNVQGNGLHTDKGLVLNGGTIESTGGIAVNIRHGQYDTDSRVDTTAPVLAAGAEGATVDGAALALAFQDPDNGNAPDHLDENSSPAATDFAVTVAGSALPVSGVNVSGATVTLTLASPVNHAETVAVGYTPGTNKIRDRWGNEAAQISSRTVRNDNPEPSLSIQAATVGEGDGTAGFTVELGAVSGAQVTVDYATADGTATAGADYTAANGTLTFAPGETSKSISVTITDDDVDEENETFTVTLGNAVNASIGQATATGTITDDDETMTTPIQTTPLANALVSTIGQARAGAATVGNIDTSTFAQAQQFTTGDDENGYTISEIVAKLEAVGSNSSPRVSIFNDSSGRPGSSLYVLTNPASLANGSNTFTTPANATLAKATNYWVVFENTATGATAGDRYDIGRTTTYNGNEDAGTASGWSIANLHYFRAQTNGSWGSHVTVLLMAIGGTAGGSPGSADAATGQVTSLSANATAGKVTLAWTAPSGTILGYRIEASYDGGSVWAEVEADTNGTGAAYAHGSGLMASETRHYRVSAITDEGAGPPSAAVEANATDTVNGLTATGLAIQDTPNGMATIDLCWKPAGIAASDLKDFAVRQREVHPSYPAEWSDQHWSPRVKSRAADCEAGSIGFRVTGSIAPNIRYTYQIRARYGLRWALSNDAAGSSVDSTLDLRADVLTGNSAQSVDTDVPATVCSTYDDPATPENDAGSFIVNIGFSTRPAVLLHYETVAGFVLADDVTLENATAELIDRPYGAQLGYRVRITPTIWGQPVAVSVPAGVVTHPYSSVMNQASNVFRRDTSDLADCGAGDSITVYPPSVRRAQILDDDDRSGVWSTGERVRVTLEFSEPVTVTTDGGVPAVSLTIAGETVQASYTGGTGSDTLVFEHVVTTEQSPFSSVSLLANSLSLNGGAIASPDGPAAALAHPGAAIRVKPSTGPKLTAEWVKFPPGHSGDGRKFTVRVKFSKPVTINVRYFRDYALSVTGGVVDKLWRVKGSDGEPRSDMWAIRVMPTSQQPLSLSLAANPNCDEHGAICTEDDTPLSKAISITVPGPNHDLTVADAEVEEGPGAALAFTVTMSGVAPYRVKVDYATADGTATAGQDYTAVEGTLIFERGETSKTISVPVLDDAHNDDGETLTLTLSNPKRGMIVDGEAVGTIHNNDPMPLAWLARFGREAASHVTDAIGERLRGGSGSRVTLGGQNLTSGGDLEREAVESRLAEEFLRNRGDRLLRGEDALSPSVRETSMSELLLGSSFHLASAAGDADAGPRWSVWGRGTRSSFNGAEEALTFDGDVTTATLGLDFERKKWLLGVALSRSTGDGSFVASGTCSTGCAGEVESVLTGFYPYTRYQVSDKLSLWGVLGHGQGDLTLTPEGIQPIETDIEMNMAAAGARGVLLSAPKAGGFELAVRSDALVVSTSSEAAENLVTTEAQTSRFRLLLEGSRAFKLGEDGVLTPSLEVGLRYDGGDAETGGGLEVGGSVHYAAPIRGLTIEVSVRGLLTHEERDFEEWGMSGSVRLDPGADGRGLSMRLGSAWGAASGDAESLWSQRVAGGLDRGDFEPVRSFDAEVAYGLEALRGLVTPYTGLSLSENGETWSVGGRWKLSEHLSMSLEGKRRENTDDGKPAHGLFLRGVMLW